MIQVAARKLSGRRVTLWVADVETMELAGPYDLVTANASFQWFDDLPALMPKLAQACSADGTLLFSSFGPETYRELNACLRELWGSEAATAAERFPDGAVLEHLLQEHFQEAEVQERIHTATFDCLWDLLRTIKCTGTQGGSPWDHHFTRTDVTALEQAYLDRFGRILATYQVFCGKAQRPHRNG
jgi:malonyl-CoA O-methyltransferase